MMRLRINYKKELQTRISDIYGLSDLSAKQQVERLYRQALRRSGKGRPYNAIRELYYSFTGQGRSHAFEFTDDLTLSKDVKSREEKLREDLADLIEFTKKGKKKQSPIETMIKKYVAGKIDYKEFKKGINRYKDTATYKSIQREKYRSGQIDGKQYYYSVKNYYGK